MILTVFPNRVWFEAGNGWASREPDKFDRERRKALLSDITFRRFQRALAESTKVKDTKLRKGK